MLAKCRKYVNLVISPSHRNSSVAIASLALVGGVAVWPSLGLAQSAADADGTVTTQTYLQFNSTTMSATGWSFGSQDGGTIAVAATPASSATSAYSLQGNYPVASGGQYIWADYNLLPLNTEDIYIEFYAQMPAATQGCKFLKIFGERTTSTNYADVTIPADFTGIDPGGMVAVYYGDGTTITNDTQDAIFFNGSSPSSVGRSYGVADVLTPQSAYFSSASWGTAWHHFRVHVKFNSGTSSANEQADGEIYIEIDGKVYVNATGLFNRNASNGPISYLELFGWAQNDTSPFQILYNNVRITTGGFVSEVVPDPPPSVTIE